MRIVHDHGCLSPTDWEFISRGYACEDLFSLRFFRKKTVPETHLPADGRGYPVPLLETGTKPVNTLRKKVPRWANRMICRNKRRKRLRDLTIPEALARLMVHPPSWALASHTSK